jgi:hypothetical protein
MAASAAFFFVFFVFVVLGVGSIVLLVLALVDMVRRPEWQWRMAGQERILWIILVCLVNAFGIVALIYYFSIRPKLVAVEQAVASGQVVPPPSAFRAWSSGVRTSPAGWYANPDGTAGVRYWDGVGWTQHVQGPTGATAPPGT